MALYEDGLWSVTTAPRSASLMGSLKSVRHPASKVTDLAFMFDAPKLKLLRAHRHLQELQLEIANFRSMGFGKLVTEHDGETGQHVLRFIQTRPMPASIPLTIGDFVHSLRTSLDFLASEIVRDMGHSVHRIHFPFHEHHSNLVAQAANRAGLFKYTNAEMTKLIIDDIKPYKTGNYRLWCLNRLDQIDKHRLIIAVFELRHIAELKAVSERGKVISLRNTTIGGHGEVVLVTAPEPFQLEEQPKLCFEVVFDERGYFFGEPVYETLSLVAQDVARVVNAFEALGRGGPSPYLRAG